MILIVLVMAGGCAGWTGRLDSPDIDFSVQAGRSRYLQQKGVKQYRGGQLHEASTTLQQAIAADPTNAAAHNNLGLVRYDQHRLFQAATHFETAAELRPNDPRPLNNLGMTLEAGGKGIEAIEYYGLAHELDPTHSLYLGNLLRTRIRLGENDESVIAGLKQLRFIEQRPEWIAWVDRQLALEMNPLLDRGPSVQLASANASGEDAENDIQDSDFSPGESILLAPPDGPAIDNAPGP